MMTFYSKLFETEILIFTSLSRLTLATGASAVEPHGTRAGETQIIFFLISALCVSARQRPIHKPECTLLIGQTSGYSS